MKIVDNRRATDLEWDTIWRECDQATYFHSREWAEIWRGYTKLDRQPYQPEPRLIFFSDGKKALLPLSCYGPPNSSIKNYISSPAGTFGGWISADNLDLEHGKILTKYYLKQFSYVIWRLNPYDNLSIALKPAQAEMEVTSTLPLNEEFDAIFKKWSKGHKAAVAQARKYGVQISLATQVNQWKEYFEIYQDSIKRWGDKVSSQYEWELFDEMYERNSAHIKLWIAQKDEKIIAGALCFYAKCNVVYWHGAALQEYFKMRPVNLMIYESIKHAHKNAYRWFDFNPSGGHKGVEAFKKSFGTIDIDCSVVIHTNRSLKSKIFNRSMKRIAKIKQYFNK